MCRLTTNSEYVGGRGEAPSVAVRASKPPPFGCERASTPSISNSGIGVSLQLGFAAPQVGGAAVRFEGGGSLTWAVLQVRLPRSSIGVVADQAGVSSAGTTRTSFTAVHRWARSTPEAYAWNQSVNRMPLPAQPLSSAVRTSTR